jgi:hypothetical protein
MLFICCSDLPDFAEANRIRPEDSDAIKAAKSFIDNTGIVPSLPVLGKSQSGDATTRSQLMYKSDAVPVWEEAISRTTGEITDLFVPLKGVEEVYSQVRLRELNKVSFQFGKARSKLLLRKRFGVTVAHILTYMPDGRYAANHEAVLDTLGLGLQYTDYTGMFMVSTLDGIISHSFLFEKGCAKYKIVPRTHQQSCEQEDTCTHEHAKEVPDYHIAINFYNPSVATTRGGGDDPSDSFESGLSKCVYCGLSWEECTCEEVIIWGNRCEVCEMPKEFCICGRCTTCWQDPCICPPTDVPCFICNQNPCICNFCPICHSAPCKCENEDKKDEGEDEDKNKEKDKDQGKKTPCNDKENNKANPLIKMELTPPEGSLIKAATFGNTRKDEYQADLFHQGIDFAGAVGTPVYSMFDGVVTMHVTKQPNRIGKKTYPPGYKGDKNDAGNRIYVKTTIDGKEVEVGYWHLEAGHPGTNADGSVLKEGDVVSAGDIIGRIGITGNPSPSNPHLHLGTRIKGNWVNPTNYLNATISTTSTKVSTPCD